MFSSPANFIWTFGAAIRSFLPASLPSSNTSGWVTPLRVSVRMSFAASAGHLTCIRPVNRRSPSSVPPQFMYLSVCGCRPSVKLKLRTHSFVPPKVKAFMFSGVHSSDRPQPVKSCAAATCSTGAPYFPRRLKLKNARRRTSAVKPNDPRHPTMFCCTMPLRSCSVVDGTGCEGASGEYPTLAPATTTSAMPELTSRRRQRGGVPGAPLQTASTSYSTAAWTL